MIPLDAIVLIRSLRHFLRPVDCDAQRVRRTNVMSITYSVLAFLAFLPITWMAHDHMRGARPLTSQEELKQAPKELTFYFVKEEGSPFSMDRFEGERVELQGTERKYTSTPIQIENSRGSCSIEAVPPGKYKLTIAVIRL